MSMRGVAAIAAALLLSTSCSLEPIDLDGARPLALRSRITSADGTLLARLYRENRALVPISSIPDHLADAVLAAEDQRFFEHEGYDLKSIARAAIRNWQEGEIVQGASTITQQYVKNTFFRDPPKTVERKARELRLAMEVEKLYSKEQILERYLNTVYFGDGAYGIKAAAETFFGHGIGRLNVAKSALLAAVIKAPARYNPRDHPRRARSRRDYVLDRMSVLGWISTEERDAAISSPLGVTEIPPRISIKEPYFVEAVRQELARDRRLGPTRVARENALWNGGLRVETTLDLDLQRAAERSIEGVLNQPGDPAAALVAIRPQTGEIAAMVGGRDWSASQVNLALGRQGGGSGRQSGSAFKPLVLATALESGIPLTARYESGPWNLAFSDGSVWSGTNSSEGGGSGVLNLHEALVHSVNGVFARLGVQLGAGQIAGQAELMGVRSRLPAFASISLGSAEVSVLDMAAAYATIANGGTAVEPTTVRRVVKANGQVLRPDQRAVQALAPGNAYLLTKAMEQVVRRGTGRAAQIGRPVAGKTGTTNDYGDAWFVGFTPQLVTAVWVGYPQGRVPMTNVHGIRVAGGTLPAAIWRTFMVEAMQGKPVREFTIPRSELVTVRIDPATGLLEAPWCPGKPKTMLRQLAPTEHCPAPDLPVEIAPGGAPTPSPSQGGRTGKGEASPEPSPSDSPRPTPSATKPSPSPSPTP